MDVNFDITRMIRKMTDAGKAVNRGAAKAVNAAALELRKGTPDYLRSAIDRPMPFTVNVRGVLIDKASESTNNTVTGVHAKIKLARLQASYLAPLEHGGSKEKGVRPAMGVKGAEDRFGNISKKYYRGDATRLLLSQTTADRPVKKKKGKARKGSGRVPRYFIGSAQSGRTGRPSFLSRILGRGGSRGIVGLYERVDKNSKIRLVAEYYRKQNYSPRLGLISHWKKEYRGMFARVVRPVIEEELRKIRR